MKTLTRTMEKSILEHGERINVKFTPYESQKKNVIRLKLGESYDLLKTRVEFIDVVIVKLENSYNKDRLAPKNYKVR